MSRIQEKIGEIHRIRSKTFGEQFKDFIKVIFSIIIILLILAAIFGDDKKGNVDESTLSSQL